MSLPLGARLGPYEILTPLGAGGMGEVYRARDARLHRDVAIKVLPDSFATDPDRLARFEREAQLLASLNHPNIAGIYGLEESDPSASSGRTVRALVLELVEGPTLADRIALGPIPVDEALSIAHQIAEALEAAHEHGIIHRDLKPANIKVRQDGTVKVLDFGLAKLAQASDSGLSASDLSQSPTITTPAATLMGVVMGTAAYMSPEQARGKPVDKRADIWAFGCVLYEMLTGTRAFDGEDVAETIAALIHKEPLWAALPASTPLAVRATLQRCLQKNPKQRLRDIGDVRLVLDGAFENAAIGPAERLPSRRRRIAELAAASIVVAVVTGLAAWAVSRPAPPVVNLLRFQLQPPENTAFATAGFAPSPDGRHVAFMAIDQTGRQLLWVHSFDTGESRPLSSTLSVTNVPWWSPDSRYVAFFADGKLRKVDISGSPPQTICDLPSDPSLGSWNQDDVIIFGYSSGGVMQVAAAGGTPTPVTALDTSRQERGHTGPRFLPDGRHFIYTRVSRVPENSGIFAGSLDAKPEEQDLHMLAATSLSPAYAPSPDPRVGYVLYVREGTLLARRVDNVTLQFTGEAIPVAEQVGGDNGNATGFFAVSATGVLIYRHGARSDGMLVWVDRTGREMTPLVAGVLKQPEFPRLSPDGRRLALTLARDIWVYDVGGRPPIKLTFDGGHFAPLWTPDGRRLVYETNTPAPLRSISADGTGTPEAVSPEGHYHPHGWSADGQWLLAVRLGTRRTEADIVKIPIGKHGEVQPVVATAADEGSDGATISPDGHWLAYVSNATGQPEVWVQPFPGPGAPVRVSPNGGVEPVWARNGRELYYLEANKMMAVAVDSRAGFTFKPATAVFEHRYVHGGQPPSYDVAADGRFLMIKAADTSAATAPITVVLNWLEALKPQAAVH